MPSTKRALFGLDPWSGIKDPESMPYYLKRGIASLILKENGESETPYNSQTTWKQFVRAYKIIGASLVRSRILKSPQAYQGRLLLTADGRDRERALRRARLKRARRVVEYLDELLVKMKADLEAGVIKETQE